MKRCHTVTKEITRIHKCSMCSCVYNSLNALNKHLNVYHGFKTKKSNKNVQKNIVQKSVETDDISETINLIKGKILVGPRLKSILHNFFTFNQSQFYNFFQLT